jgi:diguanylate cyclase (GGDEF)-like protein
MPAKAYTLLWETITKNQTWSGEIKNRKIDGSDYWVYSTISPIFDEENEKIGYMAIQQDISDKKYIEHLSVTDALTGIYNRRHFNELFPRFVNTNKRNNQMVCLLLLDIDFFKQYNDHYGHQAGDKALIQVAKCIQSQLQRGDDRVFRLGGEEFGVIFSTNSEENAMKFALRIKKAIYNLKIPHAYSVAAQYITVSGGMVCKEANYINCLDELYKEADDLLYLSKKEGKNRVSI